MLDGSAYDHEEQVKKGSPEQECICIYTYTIFINNGLSCSEWGCEIVSLSTGGLA